MNLSKDDLKSILAEIVDELPLEKETEEEIPESTAEVLRISLNDAITRIIGANFWVTKKVMCTLPNNVELVEINSAVKCGACASWYCAKHNLDNCPRCGHSM